MPFKSLDPAWAQRHPAVESQKASEKAKRDRKAPNSMPCRAMNSDPDIGIFGEIIDRIFGKFDEN